MGTTPGLHKGGRRQQVYTRPATPLPQRYTGSREAGRRPHAVFMPPKAPKGPRFPRAPPIPMLCRGPHAGAQSQHAAGAGTTAAPVPERTAMDFRRDGGFFAVRNAHDGKPGPLSLSTGRRLFRRPCLEKGGRVPDAIAPFRRGRIGPELICRNPEIPAGISLTRGLRRASGPALGPHQGTPGLPQAC